MAKSLKVFEAYSGFQKFHLENTCFRFGLIRLPGGEQKIGMFSGSAAKRPVGSFKDLTETGLFHFTCRTEPNHDHRIENLDRMIWSFIKFLPVIECMYLINIIKQKFNKTKI